MKLLSLLFLALVLGGVVLYLVLGSSPGRGTRGDLPSAGPGSGPGSPSSPSSARRAQPAARVAPISPSPRADAQRHSAEAGVAPETHAIFEGAVIAEGAPLSGVHLEIKRLEELLASGVTDERGRFHLQSKALTSAATLSLRARGFVAVERTLVGRPAGGTMMLGNLRLLRGQRVTGRVIDGRGLGIADAELRAEPHSAAGDLLVARGRSGPDGRFELADAPPGPLLVRASAKGFGEQSVQHTPGKQVLEIQLQPGAELRLFLRTPSGQPVVGAEILIQVPNDARAAKREGRSDETGRALFEGLAARAWSVRVTHPDYRTNSRGQVQATGAEEVIECVPWPAIEGLVLAPGGAAIPAGTRAQALPASAPSDRIAQFEGGQPIGPDGRFRLGGLRPGDWRVRVVAPGFAPALSAPVKLGIEGDGFAGTIALVAGGELVLTLELEGQPVAGAELELFTAPPTPAQLWAYSNSRGSGASRRTVSAADGRATLADLGPGTVWVGIYAEGCPPLQAGPFEVGAQPAPSPVKVELVRGGRIRGRVLSQAGTPVARAQLRIVERAGRLAFPLTLASAEDGSYASAWLPPGRYAVEVFASEDPAQPSRPEELDLAAGEQHVLDLTL